MMTILLAIGALIACVVCYLLGSTYGYNQCWKDQRMMLRFARDTYHDRALTSEERHISEQVLRHVETVLETGVVL